MKKSISGKVREVYDLEDGRMVIVTTDRISAFQNRLVNGDEDARLRELIDSYCFEYLFYQDLSDDTSWLPDFRRRQPFSSALAKPVWHWQDAYGE